MTTENSAKAQTTASDDGLDEAIQKAIEQTEEASDAPVTASQLDSILQDKLKPVFDQVQGRAQTFYGNRLKEETSTIRQESEAQLAQVIADFTEILDEDQREEFARLQQARRAEAQQKRMNEALDYIAEQKKAAASKPRPAEMKMTQDEVALLNEEASDLIDRDSLNGISPESPQLWQGWNPSMTYTQSMAVLKRNVRTLRKSNKPATPPARQARAQDAVPPSLTDAPVVADPGVMTLGEAAQAVRTGGMTSGEFRELGKKKGWFR